MSLLAVLIEDRIRNAKISVSLDGDWPLDVVVDSIVKHYGLPRFDFDHNPIEYQLVRAADKTPLRGNMTLSGAGINEHELLQLISPQGITVWQEVQKILDEIELEIIDATTGKPKDKVDEEARKIVTTKLAVVEQTQIGGQRAQRVRELVKNFEDPIKDIKSFSRSRKRYKWQYSLILVGVELTVVLIEGFLLWRILAYLIPLGAEIFRSCSIEAQSSFRIYCGPPPTPEPSIVVQSNTEIPICRVYIWQSKKDRLSLEIKPDGIGIFTLSETGSYNMVAEECNTHKLVDARFQIKMSKSGTYYYEISNDDRDEDGLSKAYEAMIGTDPDEKDTDGDGLTDKEEFEWVMEEFGKNSDPTEFHSDTDGYSDGREMLWGTDPTRSDDPPLLPSIMIRNDTEKPICEIYIWQLGQEKENNNKLPPLQKLNSGQSDRIALPAGSYNMAAKPCGQDEIDARFQIRIERNGYSYIHFNRDQPPFDEIRENGVYLYNVSDDDQDRDGLSKTYEEMIGTNPDKEGGNDTDGDSLTDKKELELGTNPLRLHSDNDGYSDGREVKWGTDPTRSDDPPPQPSIIVQNDSDIALCEIYIKRSIEPQGYNVLPPLEELGSYAFDTFPMPEGLYFIQITACTILTDEIPPVFKIPRVSIGGNNLNRLIKCTYDAKLECSIN